MIGWSGAAAIVSLSEAQAYVRIETGDEEALLAGLIRSASALCETFLNQVVVARSFTETSVGTGEWQRLRAQPIRSLSALAGSHQPVEMDIDGEGVGWVRGTADLTFDVSGIAGLAADENDVPEPIRQGVIRLAAHMFSNRDGSSDALPSAVKALWQPYRKLVLG